MSKHGKKPGKNRSANGRFTPGNRANPKGRPKGAKNKATRLIEELLAGEAEALTRSLIRRALAGHGTALSIIFGALLPRSRERTITVPLPPDDLVAAHGAVLTAVAAGEIAPAEGHALAGLIDLKRRAEEHAAFAARLAALEARAAAPSSTATP